MNQEPPPTANWEGYDFSVYGLDTDWNDVPGVYIFVCLTKNIWHPLYVGETGSFSGRPLSPKHEKWNEALQLGMNQIHALRVSGRKDHRQAIEGAIYDAYHPHLNDMVPPGSKDSRTESYLPRDWR